MKISAPLVIPNSLPVSLQIFFLLGRKQKIWDRAAHDSHSIRSEVEADVLATYNASLTCNTKLYLQKAIS